MKNQVKRGSAESCSSKKSRTLLYVAVIISLLGILAIIFSSYGGITGKLIDRPEGECHAVEGTENYLQGLSLINPAEGQALPEGMVLAKSIRKKDTCGMETAEPASTLKQFYLLGKSCEAQQDGNIKITLENNAVHILKNGCADDNYGEIASGGEGSKLILSSCANDKDVLFNIISCKCQNDKCVYITDLQMRDAPPCNANQIPSTKENGLGEKCYSAEAGPCLGDECAKGLICNIEQHICIKFPSFAGSILNRDQGTPMPGSETAPEQSDLKLTPGASSADLCVLPKQINPETGACESPVNVDLPPSSVDLDLPSLEDTSVQNNLPVQNIPVEAPLANAEPASEGATGGSSAGYTNPIGDMGASNLGSGAETFPGTIVSSCRITYSTIRVGLAFKRIYSDDCSEGKYCLENTNTCAARKGKDAACTEDRECLSNTCLLSKCTALANTNLPSTDVTEPTNINFNP